MSKNNTLLYVEKLSKTYHDLDGEVIALKDVTFDIQEKEFISIIGPSGCGKSTILSILSGIDKDYSGEIVMKDDLSIGYMLQSDSLLPWKTIFDNCLLGLKIKNKLTPENMDYVEELLKKYGLYEFKDKYPTSLSGGMRQRVALIRTLALKPDILLLDEPLSALDSQSRMEIGKDIFHIIKAEGKTAIMVTHDIGEALSTSDRIILFRKRPGSIQKIYNLDFHDIKDPYERRKHEFFPYYQEMIWSDFNVS